MQDSSDELTRKSLHHLVRRDLLPSDAVAADEPPQATADRLIQSGKLSEVQFANALAEVADTELVFADPENLDWSAVEVFPQELLRAHRAVPILREPDALVVGFDQVPTSAAVAELQEACGQPIRSVLMPRSQVFRFFGGGPTPAGAHASELPDWLLAQVEGCLAAASDGLRLDPVGDEVLVRQRDQDGWSVRDRLPLSALAAAVSLAGKGPIALGEDARGEVRVYDGDARGPSVELLLRRWGPQPRLADFAIDSDTQLALQCVLTAETGLVACCSRDEEAAARLVLALTSAVARRRVVALHPPRPERLPPELRRCAEREDALAAEVVGLVGLHRPALEQTCEAARSRLIITTWPEPDAHAVLLGALEDGCRPSVLARVLTLVVGVAPRAPHTLELIRLGVEDRRAVARADRGYLARSLVED